MFARQRTKFRGQFATNNVLLTITNGVEAPLGVVQQLSLQYTRNYNRVYSLTKDPKGQDDNDPGREVDAYLVGGRTQGQGQIGRLLGPAAGNLKSFYESIADECKLKQLDFSLGAGDCGATHRSKYSIIDTTMSGMSLNVTAQEYMITEGVQLIFADVAVT